MNVLDLTRSHHRIYCSVGDSRACSERHALHDGSHEPTHESTTTTAHGRCLGTHGSHGRRRSSRVAVRSVGSSMRRRVMGSVSRRRCGACSWHGRSRNRGSSRRSLPGHRAGNAGPVRSGSHFALFGLLSCFLSLQVCPTRLWRGVHIVLTSAQRTGQNPQKPRRKVRLWPEIASHAAVWDSFFEISKCG